MRVTIALPAVRNVLQLEYVRFLKEQSHTPSIQSIPVYGISLAIKPITLLRLLGSLCPKLHKAINKRITTNSKDYADSDVPPAVVVVVDVDSLQVITTTGVLTDSALASSLWIGEVGMHAHALKVVRKVAGTRLTARRVENRKLRFRTQYLLVEYGESEKPAHEVGEGVDPVHPVTPELLDLTVGYKYTAEGHQHRDDKRVDQ